MTPKKELQVALRLALVLFVVGVLSYAAFPVQKPEEPVRIMFHNAGGKVLFDHNMHTDASGYGISCMDCHHHPEDDEAALRACGDCHSPTDDTTLTSQTCLECHDEGEVDGSDATKRANAFHIQCRNCHDDFGKGPSSKNDACKQCHIM